MARLGFAEIDKAFKESGLSNSEIDKASTKFLINPAYKDATKDDLEKYIADYKDELGLHDITKTTVEAETTKEVDTNSNRREFDVLVVTHPDVFKAHGNEEFATYGSGQCISHFDGTTQQDWNNYIQKRGCQNAIIDFMEQAKKDFPDGKVPSKKTIQRHIKKLIESDVPLMKVEKYNGKVYYKLLNSIDGKYYIRVPYAQMRELVIVTNGHMLRLYALVCSILRAKGCGYDKYYPITRKYLAECLGYNANSEVMLAEIGTMLRALCKLGHLECLEETRISDNGNTYKTIHSYRRTTLAEWQEANKRGTIKK